MKLSMSLRGIASALGTVAFIGTALACGTSTPDGGARDAPGGTAGLPGAGGFGAGGENSSGGSDSPGGGALGGATAGSATGGATAGSATGGVAGGGAAVGLAPITCASSFADPADYVEGLPLLTSNPGAGLVLFVDFDGGTYSGTSYTGYYTGTAAERANIVKSFNHLVQYFAMFDVSLTTDASKTGAASGAKNWGWIVVTPDYSGGNGKYEGIGERTEPGAVCGSATLTSRDRSRRIAHELGHNMNLYHDGLFEAPSTQDLTAGTDTSGDSCTSDDSLCFFKFEDSAGWDGKYGSIMGGGGEGERNGWGLALYDPGHGGTADNSNLQDEMDKVRLAALEKGGSTANKGWAIDDHADTELAPLCVDSAKRRYVVGVLGHPDDVDLFSLVWGGGDLNLTWSALDVSAALLDIDVYQNGAKIGDERITALAAGAYEIRVKSTGEYGALGYYRLDVDP